jgi:hypothetical protein
MVLQVPGPAITQANASNNRRVSNRFTASGPRTGAGPDHLRIQQEAISRKMIDAARGAKQNEGQATTLWIDMPGRRVAASM